MCKNSTRYNRTRNFGLCGDAEGKKTEKFVFRSALRPNQISFSHNQDPKLTSPPQMAQWVVGSRSAAQEKSDLFEEPIGSRLMLQEQMVLALARQ